jgi:hypothetical protein
MESPYTVKNDTHSIDGLTEIQHQICWLMREIGREAVHLKALKAQLSQDEKRLATFMENYLNQVGDCFVGVPSGLSARSAWRPFAKASSENEHTSPYAEKAIQQLYRKLVKILHPDAWQGEEALTKHFHLLQEAYETRDVEMLSRLEALVGEGAAVYAESEVERLERLEQRYQIILNEKDRLLVKQNAMKNSAEWELMLRVQAWGSRSGEVMSKIRSTVLAERGLSVA